MNIQKQSKTPIDQRIEDSDINFTVDNNGYFLFNQSETKTPSKELRRIGLTIGYTITLIIALAAGLMIGTVISIFLGFV